MKRYLLFSGEDYYPQGGFEDLVFSSDSIDECKQFVPEEGQFAHIVDSEIQKIVWEWQSVSDGAVNPPGLYGETRHHEWVDVIAKQEARAKQLAEWSSVKPFKHQGHS